MSEQDDRLPRDGCAKLTAEQLTDRFRRLPSVDPQRLREDIDVTVDQQLSGAAPEDDR